MRVEEYEKVLRGWDGYQDHIQQKVQDKGRGVSVG